MEKYRYRLSIAAKEDLWRIYRYGVVQFGEKQADKYLDTLYQCFVEIAKNPFLYQKVDDIKPGYHRCVSGADAIYYRVNNSNVDIMAILGQQDTSRWLSCLSY